MLCSKVTGDAKYADTATAAGAKLFTLFAVPGHPGIYYDNMYRNGSLMLPNSADWRNPNLYRKARPNTEGSTLKDMYAHTGNEVRPHAWRPRACKWRAGRASCVAPSSSLQVYRTKFLESLDRLVELQDDAGTRTLSPNPSTPLPTEREYRV